MKTKSEELFESFLNANKLPFQEIKREATKTPDYLVSAGRLQLVFELKELAEDDNFVVVKDPAFPHIRSHSRTMGDHVRSRIERSRKQIQFGADRGIPSVLLIYNISIRCFRCSELSRWTSPPPCMAHPRYF